jgi:Delta3,5-Delta2,4-dienoyl-CoA isomerase
MADDYSYEYFNITFPAEYVAQVEINRPEKLNAFIEKWVYVYYVETRLLGSLRLQAKISPLPPGGVCC